MDCIFNFVIGNPDCWHGSLDILLGNMECFVNVVPTENEISPGCRESVEMKLRSAEERGFRRQTLEQAIVFSYLQKQRHSTLNNFLIPCMAATRKEIYFTKSLLLRQQT